MHCYHCNAERCELLAPDAVICDYPCERHDSSGADCTYDPNDPNPNPALPCNVDCALLIQGCACIDIGECNPRLDHPERFHHRYGCFDSWWCSKDRCADCATLNRWYPTSMTWTRGIRLVDGARVQIATTCAPHDHPSDRQTCPPDPKPDAVHCANCITTHEHGDCANCDHLDTYTFTGVAVRHSDCDCKNARPVNPGASIERSASDIPVFAGHQLCAPGYPHRPHCAVLCAGLACERCANGTDGHRDGYVIPLEDSYPGRDWRSAEYWCADCKWCKSTMRDITHEDYHGRAKLSDPHRHNRCGHPQDHATAGGHCVMSCDMCDG